MRANLGEKRQVLSMAGDIPLAAYHGAVNYKLVGLHPPKRNRLDALFKINRTQRV